MWICGLYCLVFFFGGGVFHALLPLLHEQHFTLAHSGVKRRHQSLHINIWFSLLTNIKEQQIYVFSHSLIWTRPPGRGRALKEN